jgi:hypothetical protein
MVEYMVCIFLQDTNDATPYLNCYIHIDNFPMLKIIILINK